MRRVQNECERFKISATGLGVWSPKIFYRPQLLGPLLIMLKISVRTESTMHVFIVGVKFDLGTGTDLTEASVLGYKNSYIKVYSNSWGPSDFGFVVDGPGTLAKRALATGVTQVCTYLSPLFLLTTLLSPSS